MQLLPLSPSFCFLSFLSRILAPDARSHCSGLN